MTGYTGMLEDMGHDVTKWLKTSAVRALGVCVVLRDEPSDLTQAQILKKLAKTNVFFNSGYHQEGYDEACKNLEARSKRTDKEWEKLYAKSQKEEGDEYRADLDKFHTRRIAFEASTKLVKRLFAKAQVENASEVTVGALRFADEQLTSTMDHDFRPDREPSEPDCLKLDLEQWKTKDLTSIQWSIDYHKKNIEEEKAKAKQFDHAEEYSSFCQWVDSNV